MKSTISTSAVCALVLFFFVFSSVFTPEAATAKFRDRSDELGDDFPTATVILAAVTVGGLITYILLKKSKKDDAEQEENESDDATEGETGEETSTDLSNTGSKLACVTERPTSQTGSKIGFFFDLDSSPPLRVHDNYKPSLSDVTVKVGVTLGF